MSVETVVVGNNIIIIKNIPDNVLINRKKFAPALKAYGPENKDAFSFLGFTKTKRGWYREFLLDFEKIDEKFRKAIIFERNSQFDEFILEIMQSSEEEE